MPAVFLGIRVKHWEYKRGPERYIRAVQALFDRILVVGEIGLPPLSRSSRSA